MLIRGLASLGRWDGTTFIKRPDAHFSGDAIADLRTKDNTLSVWFMNTSIEENDAIVAMCLNRSSLGKFVYVTIAEEELNKCNIDFKEVLGRSDDVTKKEILEQHRDLINLDYDQLGVIAQLIHDKVTAKSAKTLTDKKVAKLIIQAVEDGKVQYNNRNKVIVESYELLRQPKPIDDYKSDSELIKEKDGLIEKLNSSVESLKNDNEQYTNKIIEFKQMEYYLYNPNKWQRLIFLLKAFFKSNASIDKPDMA